MKIQFLLNSIICIQCIRYGVQISRILYYQLHHNWQYLWILLHFQLLIQYLQITYLLPHHQVQYSRILCLLIPLYAVLEDTEEVLYIAGYWILCSWVLKQRIYHYNNMLRINSLDYWIEHFVAHFNKVHIYYLLLIYTWILAHYGLVWRTVENSSAGGNFRLWRWNFPVCHLCIGAFMFYIVFL